MRKGVVTRKNRGAAILGFILAAAMCLAPAAAWAKDAAATKVNVKITASGSGPTKLMVGDDPSHTLQLSQGAGTAVFSDGRKAQYRSVAVWDVFIGMFAKGWGYAKFTFKDGSFIVTKWRSSFDGSDKEGNPTFNGSGAIVNGTGEYLGIAGTYPSFGRWLAPRKDHPQGIVEAQHKWTYTLPAKQK